ncbi:enkurin domain-containing protein 1-like [Ostrinia furnacalis]|uniref:enkurin domain-containing protein 1-like n=1 Tax=Ostrinia furnacalis TaxID=93504 RepID=UPI0010388E5F|nr:enkurin domain-containing protein 1-like [Ostrinia furnacalis]
MYTLKGIFPEPKKEHKKNFIRENMKQLKFIQGKSPKEPKFTLKSVHPPRLASGVAAGNSLGQVKSSPSNKSGKVSLNVGKTSSTNSRKKYADVRIKKGDMAEFLKRKELRQAKPAEESENEEVKSSESSGRLRDIGCQTVESNLAQKLADSAKLTMLYPKKEGDQDLEAKMKASGDTGLHRSSPSSHSPRRTSEDTMEMERNRSRLNAILERKDNKDPYLPSGYQKGVLPKYLRDRKDQIPKEAEGAKADDDQAVCPPGHVTLPDTERKETLRMLRNSFAELVSELNKMPVKTDTLRMRNRKMELEKQLAKLEEGIKVFSRPKVFVKIGE